MDLITGDSVSLKLTVIHTRLVEAYRMESTTDVILNVIFIVRISVRNSYMMI